MPPKTLFRLQGPETAAPGVPSIAGRSNEVTTEIAIVVGGPQKRVGAAATGRRASVVICGICKCSQGGVKPGGGGSQSFLSLPLRRRNIGSYARSLATLSS